MCWTVANALKVTIYVHLKWSIVSIMVQQAKLVKMLSLHITKTNAPPPSFRYWMTSYAIPAYVNPNLSRGWRRCQLMQRKTMSDCILLNNRLHQDSQVAVRCLAVANWTNLIVHDHFHCSIISIMVQKAKMVNNFSLHITLTNAPPPSILYWMTSYAICAYEDPSLSSRSHPCQLMNWKM